MNGIWFGIPRHGKIAQPAAAAGVCCGAGDRRPLSAVGSDPGVLFRLSGPGLESADGICRPIVAGPCALSRARRLHGDRALDPVRHRAVAWRICRHSGRHRGRAVDRLAWLAICDRRRLFRAADDRVRRIHPDRLRQLAGHRRRRRPVSAGQRRGRRQVVESRRRAAAILLPVARACCCGHRAGRATAAVARSATAGWRCARIRRRRRRSESTSSAPA